MERGERERVERVERMERVERDIRDRHGRTALAVTTGPVTRVVTRVETTTTVAYPAILFDPPSPTHLDPGVYPLANTPTPPALKRFCFEVDGVPTHFREAAGDGGGVDGADRERERQPSLTEIARKRKQSHSSSISHPTAQPPALTSPIPPTLAIAAYHNPATPLTPYPDSLSLIATPSHQPPQIIIPGPSPSPSLPTPIHPAADLSPTLPSPSLSPTRAVAPKMGDVVLDGQDEAEDLNNPPSLTDLPRIVRTFTALPPPLKSYLLLHLLRRCPVPTLQFVSSLVLPTLKRDFLRLLPLELAFQVVSYLDVRALGRCARVSTAWRRVVEGGDAEVAVWKQRLIREGWLREDEVEREAARAMGRVAPQGGPVGPWGWGPSASGTGSRRDRDRERARLAAEAARRRGGTPPPEEGEADGDDEGTEEEHGMGGERDDDGMLVDEPAGVGLSPRSSPGAGPRGGLWGWPGGAGSPGESSGGRTRGASAAHVYRSLYRRHHITSRNWAAGRYKLLSFPGHNQNVVTCLQFDGDKIVSGSDDQTMNVYDVRTGALRRRLEGHEGGVWALQYHGNTLVSGSTDRTVRVWDLQTGRCTHVFEGHTSTVRCLAIVMPQLNPETGEMEPEVPVIVTGSRDSTLRVWRLPNVDVDPPYNAPEPGGGAGGSAAGENPYFMHVLSGHLNSVRAIAGAGNTLVSGSYDATVRVWDIRKGEMVHRLTGHREKVYSVGYSAELRRAVSGSMDATVKVWDVRTGTMLFSLEGHTSLVGLLELTPKYLVSAAADSSLRIWNPNTGACLATLNGHQAAITCFHHDPHYNRIVSGSDGGVKVWELCSDPVEAARIEREGQGQGQGQGTGGTSTTVAYGRFLRDLVSGPEVHGVWRVRMDERRLVCAIQREHAQTFFEVLDFGDGVDEDDQGERRSGVVGDGYVEYVDGTREAGSFRGEVPPGGRPRSVPDGPTPGHIQEHSDDDAVMAVPPQNMDMAEGDTSD
ncbi:WD40 repeat-like protein [Gonapodya prolifera JEL478]|uniref:WD40 repeat-like protein n=1 Tax=Gonapodya prolifera (strain JEL478) TaxID=1344416 RepID=A0A139AV03_GONPJ|nr:WD40 repeat-like protein [Gonapodya prolifera JEL478]|eukprot:KXS20561.1 WD40 repeat-like protein [Gonapodya prolifera JEL478]